jgi:hypothetical protein
MAAIREQDLAAGKAALHQWAQAAQTALAALGPHIPDDAPGSTALSSSISAADSLSNRPGQAVIDATIPTAQAEHQTTQETTVSATPTVPTENQPTQIDAAKRLSLSPDLPRPIWALAVRYSLFLLERKAPGPGVEVRVAPWAAVKILDGPASDPHNLTPPDVIELDPDVWLRLACGITSWSEEKNAGHISAVGERDDLSALLPLAVA